MVRYRLLISILSLFLLLISWGSAAAENVDYLERGIMNFQEENYEEAVEDLEVARKRQPMSSRAAYYLGISCKKLPDYKAAAIHLRAAVNMTPPVNEAILELADALFQMEKTDEVLEYIAIAEERRVEPAQTAFLKGLVYSKKKKHDEAIEAFRVAKREDPKLTTQADFRIGVAEMQGGRLAEAAALFEKIIRTSPGSDMAEMSKQYLDVIKTRIKQEKPLKLHLSLQYQNDDNVLLKPHDFAPAEYITNESDTINALMFGVDYRMKTKGNMGFNMKYNLYLSRHDKHPTHDVTNHTFTFMPTYKRDKGICSVALSYNETAVDGKKYMKAYSFSPQYSLNLSEKQFAQAGLKYRVKDTLTPPFVPEDDQDGSDLGASLSWMYLLSEGKGFVNAGYDHTITDTEGDNWDKTENRLKLSGSYFLLKSLKLQLSAVQSMQDYKNVHLLGKRRDDKITTTVAGISYEIIAGVSLSAQYTKIKADSNLDPFKYNKTITGVTLSGTY